MGMSYTYYGFEYADKWEVYKSDEEVQELVEEVIDNCDIDELEAILEGSDFVFDRSLSDVEIKQYLLEQDKEWKILYDWLHDYIYEIVREEAEYDYNKCVAEYDRYGLWE